MVIYLSKHFFTTIQKIAILHYPCPRRCVHLRPLLPLYVVVCVCFVVSPMRMSLRATAASSKCIRECIKLPISLTIVWMTGKQNVYSLYHPHVLFSLTLSDMIFPTYSCRKRNQLSIRSTGQPILMVNTSKREGSSLLFSVWSVLHYLCYSILASVCLPSLELV